MLPGASGVHYFRTFSLAAAALCSADNVQNNVPKMKLSLYLDTRHGKDLSPLKFAIRKKNSAVYLPTSISLAPGQWDARAQRVVKHPSRAAYNNYLMRRYLDIEAALLDMQGMSLADIRTALLARFYEPEKPAKANLLLPYFERVMNSRRSANSRHAYATALSALRAWCPGLASVTFDEVNRQWLDGFVSWNLERGNCLNTCGLYLRCLRAVFNAAIDDEATTAYPFRRYKLKKEPTAKRSLELSALRELWALQPADALEAFALDMFRLIFLLMGINATDLFSLRAENYSGGRLSYRRAKTGHLYDIKVEPEAAALIERYRSPGGVWLLDLHERYSDLRSANMQINAGLHRLPGFGQLTTYWARHSWATAAAELDVPKEVIAEGLGHSSGSVTDIYIRFDRSKVDIANRRVIDAVVGPGSENR